MDQKVVYYSQQDEYISNCLARVEEGNLKEVDRYSSHACSKVDWLPDNIQEIHAKYKVYKKNGNINIDTALCFDFKGDKDGRKDAFKRVREAIPCMIGFYARHGIKLNLEIKENTNLPDQHCDHKINLYTENARTTSGEWALYKTVGVVLNSRKRCSLYLHELGHLLGLPDTYPHPECPDRELIMPVDDIMRRGISSPHEVKLYPYAIRQLLGPLCED